MTVLLGVSNLFIIEFGPGIVKKLLDKKECGFIIKYFNSMVGISIKISGEFLRNLFIYRKLRFCNKMEKNLNK